MPHDLRARLELKTGGLQSRELDQTARELCDIISGSECDFKFVVKNAGSRIFPGGNVSDLSIVMRSGKGSVEYRPTNIVHTIPSLLPGEERPVSQWKFTPRMGHLATVRIQLVASDKDVVNLKVHDGDVPENHVEFPLSVGKPTDIMTVFLLRNWRQKKRMPAPRKLLQRFIRS